MPNKKSFWDYKHRGRGGNRTSRGGHKNTARRNSFSRSGQRENITRQFGWQKSGFDDDFNGDFSFDDVDEPTQRSGAKPPRERFRSSRKRGRSTDSKSYRVKQPKIAYDPVLGDFVSLSEKEGQNTYSRGRRSRRQQDTAHLPHRQGISFLKSESILNRYIGSEAGEESSDEDEADDLLVQEFEWLDEDAEPPSKLKQTSNLLENINSPNESSPKQQGWGGTLAYDADVSGLPYGDINPSEDESDDENNMDNLSSLEIPADAQLYLSDESEENEVEVVSSVSQAAVNISTVDDAQNNESDGSEIHFFIDTTGDPSAFEKISEGASGVLDEEEGAHANEDRDEYQPEDSFASNSDFVPIRRETNKARERRERKRRLMNLANGDKDISFGEESEEDQDLGEDIEALVDYMQNTSTKTSEPANLSLLKALMAINLPHETINRDSESETELSDEASDASFEYNELDVASDNDSDTDYFRGVDQWESETRSVQDRTLDRKFRSVLNGEFEGPSDLPGGFQARLRRLRKDKLPIQSRETQASRQKPKSLPTIDFDEINKLVQRFVRDQNSKTLALQPMAPKDRKSIHKLAAIYNIKSKSVGKGMQRRTILRRTRYTSMPEDTRYLTHFLTRARRRKHSSSSSNKQVSSRQTKKMAQKAARGVAKGLRAERLREKKGKKSGEDGSRKGKAIDEAGPAHGSVVGGEAIPLGQANIGHRMLSKMGWNPGQSLGVTGEGITDPVAAVVRKKRLGLGA
ncbi:uncharacterized protein VTP21DRAFT_10114 [Calcarisporiella thermophila]|uniref:uncharacterized protein n=1 Tax=Calcarisporiella thermophila TaxID=911321 RepID=UPI0037435BAF